MKGWSAFVVCLAFVLFAGCEQANLSQGIVVTRPVALAPTATLPLSEPVTISASAASPMPFGADFTVSLVYGFQAAGDTYRWYLNGEEQLTLLTKDVTIGSDLDAGRYTLSGTIAHGAFTYAVDFSFEVQ